MFFAGYLVVQADALALAGRRFLGLDLPRGRDLGPILLAWMVSLGVLVFQRDLGTSLLFFGVFVVLLYVATERAAWLFLGGVLFVGGAWFAYIAATQLQFDHVQTRVDGWLYPFDRPTATSVPDHPSRCTGSRTAGCSAAGWARATRAGAVRQDRLHHRDARRGARAGRADGGAGALRDHRRARPADRAGRAATASASCSRPASPSVFALQVFVVVGGVTKLIPLTGLTTPFLSYGGSSLIANWILVALLLRISDAARRPATPRSGQPTEDAMTQVVVRR